MFGVSYRGPISTRSSPPSRWPREQAAGRASFCQPGWGQKHHELADDCREPAGKLTNGSNCWRQSRVGTSSNTMKLSTSDVAFWLRIGAAIAPSYAGHQFRRPHPAPRSKAPFAMARGRHRIQSARRDQSRCARQTPPRARRTRRNKPLVRKSALLARRVL